MNKKCFNYILFLTELFTEDKEFIRNTKIDKKALTSHFFNNIKRNILSEFSDSLWNQLNKGLGSGVTNIGYKLNAQQSQVLSNAINSGHAVNMSVTANNTGSYITDIRFETA